MLNPEPLLNQFFHFIMSSPMFKKEATVARMSLLMVLFSAHAVTWADVQVLRIKDASFNVSSQTANDPSGITGLSASDALCVVNTVPGKGVRLTFTSAQGLGSDGVSWKLRDSQTGAVILYRQSASLADGSGAVQISGPPDRAFIDVPADRVASSVSSCPPGGNVLKRVVLVSPPPQAGQWSDSITITATSL